MRPINKWVVGYTSTKGTTVLPVYDQHTLANPVLQENLDNFCNYCEVVDLNPDVEHIVSQDQDALRSTD